MPQKHTAPSIRAMKASGQKIVCLTAYDVVTAEIADSAGADVVLVGDSVGNVVLGYESTIPVSVDTIAHHTAAAARGVRNALLVADMPFGSYQASTEDAVRSAVTLMKAGAEAVKLEGPYLAEIAAIMRAGIPVMGHVGMTPQSVHAFGGFRVQGRGEAAKVVLQQASSVDECGVFAMVLELIPANLAKEITATVHVPTIGIGAGPSCDGQIQVFHDVTGLSSTVYRHAKPYAQARSSLTRALRKYASEVRDGTFPSDENSF